MTTHPYDLPGFVNGFRFSDDPRFYDSANKKHYDIAGYGDRAALTWNVGTPLFSTDGNGVRCLKMDNTCHGFSEMPIPWEGSLILACQPDYISGSTQAVYPMIFGNEASVTSNGLFKFQYVSGPRRLQLVGPSASGTITGPAPTDDNPRVIGYTISQEDRKGAYSLDGAAIVEANATSNNHGQYHSLHSADEGIRWGNLSGTAGDTTANTAMNFYIYAAYFYNTKLLYDYLSNTQSCIADLITEFAF